MKADAFVNEIRLLKPSKEQIDALEASDTFKNEILIQHNISELLESNSMLYKDELITLIAKYDISNLRIGQIQFKEEAIYNSMYIFVGRHEADSIVINKLNKRVEILDHETNEKIMDCANDGYSFLDAILIAKKLFLKSVFSTDHSIDQKEKHQVAFQCASLAGGEIYLDYYKYLLGCW